MWEAFTSSMIGTPCSAVQSSVPMINVFLNTQTEIGDFSNPQPYTILTNTTSSSTNTLPTGWL